MRRLWMGAAVVLLLAGCRTEQNSDQALGTERRGANEQREGVAVEPRGVTFKEFKDKDALTMGRTIALALAMNRSEIEMSKLADTRASSREVKDYATKLVNEHSKDVDELNRLVQEKNIRVNVLEDDPLIKAHDLASKEQIDKLSKLSGIEFDRAYMAAQPQSHTLLVKLLEQGRGTASDPEISKFFDKTVNVAKEHHGRALSLIPASCGGEMGGQNAKGLGANANEQKGTSTDVIGPHDTTHKSKPGVPSTRGNVDGSRSTNPLPSETPPERVH